MNRSIEDFFAVSSTCTRKSGANSNTISDDDKKLNDEVEKALKQLEKVQRIERSGKGRTNHVYTATERAQIGRFAAENGNLAASNYYEKLLGHKVPESTVRGMKRLYLQKLKVEKKPSKVQELPHHTRGRPLKLGSTLDNLVQEYLRKLAAAGGVINKNIVKASALGILKHYMFSRWENLQSAITDVWARSLMIRMNLVKRKGK